MKTEKTNDLTAYKIRIMQNKIQRTANKKQLTRTCEIVCLHFAPDLDFKVHSSTRESQELMLQMR